MNNIILLEDNSPVLLQGDPKKRIKNGGSLLGQGGQGAVYKVKKDGKTLALKIYANEMSTAFIDNLRKNIIKGSPNTSFLWPIALTKPLGKNKNRYGYIMECYDSQKYSSFSDIVKGKVNFPSKNMQLEALIDLVDAFEVLHANGYSYQDLNDGGVRFDVNKGKVLICDNDNVAPSGINIPMDNHGHYIKGKFKYMAPEVAIGMFKPDKHSDRFSLAVLMFMILLHAHPYDGIKRLSGPLTPKLQEKIYGTEPVFIFNPYDNSNKPDPQVDTNAIKAWPLLPNFIQKLFIKTFLSGMPSPTKTKDELEIERQARTSEKEWRQALQKWKDTMVSCPICHLTFATVIEQNQLKQTQCPHCKKQVKVELPILIIKKNGKIERTIVLEEGKQIAKSSVTNEKSNETAFIVKRSKKVADVFGLENNLPYDWKCSQQGAKDRLIKINEIVPALNGVHIEFDYIYSGEIIYSRH